MINSILSDWFKLNVGDGAFYAIFGFLFVFAGIALLVVIFTVLGVLMKKMNARKPKKKKIKTKKEEPVQTKVEDEGISPEVVAAITAAIMAVYEGENAKCDFIVKRIKRL